MRIEDVKIGMRVKSKVSLFGLTIGQEGTVRMLNPLTNPSTIAVGVEFDEYVGGHSIGGIINKSTGCWLIADWIEEIVEDRYDVRDEIATWRKSVDYIKSTQGETTSNLYVGATFYVGVIVEVKTGTIAPWKERIGRVVEIDGNFKTPIKVEFKSGDYYWYKPKNLNVLWLPGNEGKTKIYSVPQDKYTFAPTDGVIKEPNVTFSIKGDKEKIDSYTFKTSNLSIDKVTEDALQDGTIAFILIGEKNAIVGVLQCHESEREALYRLQDSGTYFPKYVNGEFVIPKTVEDWGTFEGAFFFNIISKDRIGKAKEILKEIKKKDVIRKELIEYKIKEKTCSEYKERFSVLTY